MDLISGAGRQLFADQHLENLRALRVFFQYTPHLISSVLRQPSSRESDRAASNRFNIDT